MRRGFVTLTILISSVACGGPKNLPARVPEPTVAPPPGDPVEHAEGFFHGAHGTNLFGQSWRPRGESKAVLVIVHGLKDHGSRYAAFASELVKHKVAVYAADLRGHGHSEGPRQGIRSFEEYLGDLDHFIRNVERAEPNKPIFLLGHSMGGAIVTLYTIERRPALAGLITSGGALRVDANGALVVATEIIGEAAPGLAVLELDFDKFSRDPEVIKAGKADPMVDLDKIPAHTAEELIHAITKIQANEDTIDVPLLALHGEADRITPPSGSALLVERARSDDKTLKLYPGLYHDLLHEPEKEQVTRDIEAFIDAHTAQEPSQASALR